jgi:hypothetical protein
VYGWLTQTEIPKLLFHSKDGVATQEPQVAWYREHPPNLSEVDLGESSHFVQETHPREIGPELAEWRAEVLANNNKLAAAE